MKNRKMGIAREHNEERNRGTAITTASFRVGSAVNLTGAAKARGVPGASVA
jgi:hypothetical protein